MPKYLGRIAATDLIDLGCRHPVELLLDPLRGERERALVMRVVVAPQQAVESGDVTRPNCQRIPHERRMRLPLQVIARMHVDLGRPHDVVDSKVVQAALAEVMVVELHCEGEPACIPLRHDDMQVGIALEHTAVRHPAQRFAHAAALHVPADVLASGVGHQPGPTSGLRSPPTCIVIGIRRLSAASQTGSHSSM